jgi:hypothetical protein
MSGRCCGSSVFGSDVSGLRLNADGRRVFVDWARSASVDDQRLVGQVLEMVADGSWKDPRWFYTRDAEDRHLVLIQPRENLVVAVRFVHDNLPEEPDTFELVSIAQMPLPTGLDE